MSLGDRREDLPAVPAIADCWNRIGVYGDATCLLLELHVHCRNCPVYSAAAIQVLDREQVSEGREAAMAEATRLFAIAKQDDRKATQSAFLFRVGAEWLALPMSVVDEAADLRAIHSLPHRRNGVVLGLANVRGELLVCVSLEQLLGIDAQTHAAATTRNQRLVHRRLLVLRHAGGRLAFPVDEAHGAERYDERELKPVPTTVAKAAARYSRAMLAWRGNAVGLLDDELLFHSLDRSLG